MFLVESSDVDARLNLKLASLFRMMQDVATEHAEQLDIGKANTIDKGLYWVITRYSVTIKRYPRYLQTINVSTYPLGRNHFLFPRNFQVTSLDGEVLVTASSSWCILDKKTHKIALHALNDVKVPLENYEWEEPSPYKIDISDATLVEKRKVRYSDIDLNGHLNNTRYIEYIVDSLGDEFHQNNIITHIGINYDREIQSGQIVDIFLKNADGIDLIQGKVDDKTIFNCKINYKKA